MQKKLLIYRNGQHIQTVTYVKAHGVWKATHFFQEKYLPFALHSPIDDHKSAMEREGLTWKWV